MKHAVTADIAIIGGGIAGLWLLNRLRSLNFSVVLLESGTLGGGQTHKAQGIIHGGMKYALHGNDKAASESIASMPEMWKACLSGTGPLNLSNIPVLSSKQYLWSTGSLSSKIAGYFASMALKGNVTSLKYSEFPTVFQNPQFKGQVYSLEEMVIDVNALVRELVKTHQDVIFKIDPLAEPQIKINSKGEIEDFEIHAYPFHPVKLNAKHYIFTAGKGNELLLNKLPDKKIKMQKRPLHMVIVKHHHPHCLYAHCLGLGVTPRVTITTHKTRDGRVAWYIGGQIAEEGVNKTKEEQIQCAKKELSELFPWLDFSTSTFSTFMIDRAEALQENGKRPDNCHFETLENATIAWPTKLAFAPLLADRITTELSKTKIQSGKADLREIRAWPMPSFALPVWDEND